MRSSRLSGKKRRQSLIDIFPFLAYAYEYAILAGGTLVGLLELFLVAVGLSMDAFAVAVCKGLTMERPTYKKCGIVGLYFGVFQALMPLIGYLVGLQFESQIKSVDHWVAFILLAVIGINMIVGALKKDEEETPCSEDLRFKTMLPLAIATSIDALAVGVTFAFLNVDIIPAVLFIGVVTFLLSAIGVKIGHLVGGRFKSRAELAGGVILILIGTKILLEHLGILPF